MCVWGGGQANDFLHTVWTDGPLRGPGVQPPLAVWGIFLHVRIAVTCFFPSVFEIGEWVCGLMGVVWRLSAYRENGSRDPAALGTPTQCEIVSDYS